MSRIRIGIIGAGGRGINAFGRNFTELFSNQTEIVAVADPNRERAEAGLALLGLQAKIHADYNDLVRRQDIDAVVVTTPDYLHEQCCLAAFKHGKHALVDKPLAISGAGCLRVIAAARQARKLLYMGFNLRHDIVLRKLKSLVESGTFGEIFSMQAIEYYNGGRTYMARWNRLKKFSGGLFIHKGSHDFDIINWMMGQARPMQVSCFANVFTLNPRHLPFKLRRGVKPGPTCTDCPYQSECPDVSIAGLKPGQGKNAGLSVAQEQAHNRMFGADSVRLDGYHKDLCMYLSDKDTHDQGIAIVEYDNGATASNAEYFVTPKSNRHYLIEGTLGHGEADLHENTIEILPRWTQDRILHQLKRPVGGHGGADPHMCGEFIRCIRQGLRPSASGIDGAWSVAIGEASERSRVKGRVVKISEVLDIKSPLLKK